MKKVTNQNKVSKYSCIMNDFMVSMINMILSLRYTLIIFYFLIIILRNNNKYKNYLC